MNFKVGDEVTYIETGEKGKIIAILYYDGTDDVFMYQVDINGKEYSCDPLDLE